MGETSAAYAPQKASVLNRAPTLRTLLQGYPRVGKTTTVVKSCVDSFGYGYIINCGTATGLEPALRETGPDKWEFNTLDYGDFFQDQIEASIGHAREGCASGRYKWLLIDDFNYYVDELEGSFINEDTQKDFNRWPAFCRRVTNTLNRLFVCDAHIIVTCHLNDWKSTQLQGQNKKDGIGFVNVFPGKLRATLPGMFAEVAVLKYDDTDTEKRILCVNQQGVYGVGCRTLSASTQQLEPDLGLLQREIERWKKSGPFKPAPVTKSAAPVRPAPATPKPNLKGK